jgi:2-keto-4-pentenoate hydratase
MSAAFDVAALARLFAEARGHRAKLDDLPETARPASADDAYATQEATLRALGADSSDSRAIGGWKVGSKSADGPIQGALLPASGMHESGVHLSMQAFGKAGLELEVAFTFKRSFDANSGPYSDDDIWNAIDSVHAAIEVVASRFAAWPDIDKIWQLADLQNHGALIVGEFMPYHEDFPFVAPALRFDFNGRDVVELTPANPAGDPRRLLTWLVNHATSRGITVTPDMIVTTGSYTGMFFPRSAGMAHGRIEGLPPVSVTLY